MSFDKCKTCKFNYQRKEEPLNQAKPEREPEPEIYRFENRRYKKGRFGFTFVEINGDWIRTKESFETIKKRGTREKV